MALYSTLAGLLDIVDYFLDLQDTKEFPGKIQKPVIDFLVSVQPVPITTL